MPQALRESVSLQHVELAGVRYVILPESEFLRLCPAARAPAPNAAPADPSAETGQGQLGPFAVDGATLARRLLQRRHRAGLTQVELARRAGIRVETLNRIERGRNTPDFATVRKLVEAMRRSVSTGQAKVDQ